MPLRVRGMLGIGIVAVLPLMILLLVTPPDGASRLEIAQFLGRFHPIVVHFPIALLLLVPVLEGAAMFRDQPNLRESAGFVLVLATAAAITAAWLGWLLAWSGGYEGSLVTRHMWGGVSLAAACLICCGLYSFNRNVYAVALMATFILLIWTSDQGGKLTHGTTFLTEQMPQPFRGWLGPEKKADVDPTSFYATRVQPIFEQKCVLCHDATKFKGKLRLDSYAGVMRGGKDGRVIQPAEPGKSELLRRVTLQPESKDFMPAEGKPALDAAEIKTLEAWIAAGAGIQVPESALNGLPSSPEANRPHEPLAPDYRPQSQTIAALESSLGVRLVPRSQTPTDGLILRTASAPDHCSDTTLQQLAPIANLIVDAELARTKVTDKGLRSLASFPNLRFLDLSYTSVTAAGANDLMKLEHIESLNLTETKVTRNGISELATKPGLKRLYLFETR